MRSLAWAAKSIPIPGSKIPDWAQCPERPGHVTDELSPGVVTHTKPSRYFEYIP
jgi:hypothetical protein